MMKDIRYNLTAPQHVHVAMEHLNVNHKPVVMMMIMHLSLPVMHMVILTISHLMGATLISKGPVNMFLPHHATLRNLPLQSQMVPTMNMYLVLMWYKF